MSAEARSLLLLLNWMSPTFPIGGFAYSHGTEQAIVDGRLKSTADVEGWIGDVLEVGSGWNDAVLFSLCWTEDVGALNELALALAGSAERYLETTQLGRGFALAAAVWTGAARQDAMMAFPVAAGDACRSLGIAREKALAAFLQGFSAALVSVAVRLVPLGQTSGLVLLRNLSPVIIGVTERLATASLGDLGSCCVAAEVATMRHETLEPRIFRT